jgi:hypothetical protein
MVFAQALSEYGLIAELVPAVQRASYSARQVIATTGPEAWLFWAGLLVAMFFLFRRRRAR